METLFKTFLTISLTASVMLLVVMAVRAIYAKRINPAVVAALWMLILVRLCMPFSIETPVHVGSLFPPSAQQAAIVDGDTSDPLPHIQPSMPNTIGQPVEQTVSAAQAVPTSEKTQQTPAISWWRIMAWVWLAGTLAVLLITVVQGVAFRRKINSCTQIADESVGDLMNRHKQMLMLKRSVIAVECTGLHTPAVYGCFRPVILLPRKFLQMDTQTMSFIILHELCHIKRRDVLKCYAWLAAKALHWFNPLVWMAFNMVKDDIELCCDDAVTRRLETDSRYAYTQSLIDVFRLSRQGEALPGTVSLFESRAKLTQRVKRMLKPERRLKSAAVVSALLALVMVVAGFTTACMPADLAQETPEKTNPVVVSVQPATRPSAEATPTPMPALDYAAPEKWTDSFSADGDKLKVNMNADIVLPNVSEIATYNVQPDAAFSQEMADKLISVLFGDAQVYQMANPTKQMLQRQIDRYSSEYKSMQEGTYVFMDDWEDAAKQTRIENVRLYLDDLKEQLKTATDASTLVPLDTTIPEEQNGIAGIAGMADLGHDEWATFNLGNHSNSGSNVTFHNNGGYTVEFADGIEREAPLGDLTISEAEAREQADELLSKLGLTDFACCSSSISGKNGPQGYGILENGYAHMLIYTRKLGGLTLAPFTTAPFSSDEDSIFIYEKYRPEFILITVNDQGICDFQWMNNIEIRDVAQKNTTLLPFNAMSELIKQKIIEQYTGVADELSNEIGHGENWWKTDEYILNIDRIALEYAMMPVNGDADNPMIVPVWSVYGSTEWWFWKEVNGEKVKDSVIDPNSRIMLTINALDGSVL